MQFSDSSQHENGSENKVCCVTDTLGGFTFEVHYAGCSNYTSDIAKTIMSINQSFCNALGFDNVTVACEEQYQRAYHQTIYAPTPPMFWPV